MKSIKYFFVFLLPVVLSNSIWAQIKLSGIVRDAVSQEKLSYVNIGIKKKSVGTCSSKDGRFSIDIPKANEADTLTFFMIGYNEVDKCIKDLKPGIDNVIELHPKKIMLDEVVIKGQKLSEKKFGLKKSPVMHFNESYHDPNDIYELAHLIKLGNSLSKITSINLLTDGSRSDSVTYRVNFYAFDGYRPGNRLIEKSIVQTQVLKGGWIKIDLSSYNIYLKDTVVAALEFIPSSDKQKNNPINYPIKIGGSSKTFVRMASLGEWNVPPAHYRIFVTALVPDKGKKSEKEEIDEEEETFPTVKMFSEFVKDSFSVFVKLPDGYDKNKQYPTAYLLDGNFFVDNVGNSIKYLNKKELLPELILVGIGYENAYAGDSLRDRDYTSIKALDTDSFKVSGGADNFLAFIGKELIPYIDKTYKTDTNSRTIMGHSLGGHFVLYTLNKTIEGQSKIFANFIAGSPSVHYHNEYLFQQLKGISGIQPRKQKIYMTMGGLERDEDGIKSFQEELCQKKFEKANVKAEIYPNQDHMETAIPSFEKGLQFVISNKN